MGVGREQHSPPPIPYSDTYCWESDCFLDCSEPSSSNPWWFLRPHIKPPASYLSDQAEKPS